MNNRRLSLKKVGCAALCCVMIITAMFAGAQEMQSAGNKDQNIRVLLSRLKLGKRMDITLSTPYQLKSVNAPETYFQAGSNLTFHLTDGQIYLHYSGMSQMLGKKVLLERCVPENDDKQGFYLTNFPALYMGDLQLEADENGLKAILKIHVEDYLHGVVPYEMSEIFPLEALKAQAIAARTYALRKQNPDAAYDVVDTTNDQVFKGYLPGNIRSEQAIQETRGVCGFYKNKLAQCFYSASNGGQTEMPGTVWEDAKDITYYAFGEDPYDLANPESLVREFRLQKQYQNQTAPVELRQMIVDKLADVLALNGFAAATDHVRIDRIVDVDLNSPDRQNSKRMTRLRITMEISGRTEQKSLIRILDENAEEVSLFEDEHSLENTVDLIPKTSDEEIVPEIEYGPWVALKEPVLLDVPVFPYAEDILNLNVITNYENEIWTVAETADTFTIEARRYGHGVGMSQRGAQWMAEKHDMSFQDILAFYYPGMQLMRYSEQKREYAEADNNLVFTPGPAPSPTPRPTLMPLTQIPLEGQWYAEVTEISEDSSLNLRSEPNLNSDILMRLYKGQSLLVIERCHQEGWVRVKTDVAEGFVMESFLSRKNR